MLKPRVRRARAMIAWLERLGGQIPPRLKAILNLAITLCLLLLSVPFLWAGVSERAWSELSLGAGLFLLGIFNLLT